MKALLWYLGVAVVFLSGVILLVILVGPRLKTVAVSTNNDQWAARQCVRLSNIYLNYTLEYDDAVLVEPDVLRLRGVRLTPREREDASPAARAPEVRVHFADAPRFGTPVVIRSVSAPGFQAARPLPGAAGWLLAMRAIMDLDNLLNPSHIEPGTRLDNAFHVEPEPGF